MKFAAVVIASALLFAGCSGKPAGNRAARNLDDEPVPPEITEQMEAEARAAAAALDDAKVTAHRAYNYQGYSSQQTLDDAKLVGVDVEFAGTKEGFDLDDVEILDAGSGESFGGKPEIAFLTAKGEVVPDAVVSLIPLSGPAPAVAPGTSVEIEQAGQEFQPYVTVVQAGTPVIFPNRDSVPHHVYSLSKAKKFELPLYNPGKAESFVFDAPGIVTLGCNIHDWMVAYLIVVPTPYFAKTGVDGSTKVSAPDGRYRLELLHPRLATPITQEIALAGSAAIQREFTVSLKPDRRIRRGPDGKSGGYR